MRIGIYGGTFNPIHRGHLTAAAAAAKQLCLDKLLLVPDAIRPTSPCLRAVPMQRIGWKWYSCVLGSCRFRQR